MHDLLIICPAPELIERAQRRRGSAPWTRRKSFAHTFARKHAARLGYDARLLAQVSMSLEVYSPLTPFRLVVARFERALKDLNLGSDGGNGK